MRVTTLKGADAGAYYVEQLPNYYLQSGEPRGVWLGDAAPVLGLTGEIEDDDFLALMAGMDPQRPDRHLGRRYNDKSARGYDVTASAPKSVSILFALGDDEIRREVLDAHDAAVTALAGWIERHAHTRYRIGGEVAVVDAEGIVAAMFRQHTSRALDPQLHTHLVIANRVKSPTAVGSHSTPAPSRRTSEPCQRSTTPASARSSLNGSACAGINPRTASPRSPMSPRP